MNMNIDMEMLKSLQPLLIDYGSKIIAALVIFLIGKLLARKITFDERGISFPFPQQDVHLYKAAE